MLERKIWNEIEFENQGFLSFWKGVNAIVRLLSPSWTSD